MSKSTSFLSELEKKRYPLTWHQLYPKENSSNDSVKPLFVDSAFHQTKMRVPHSFHKPISKSINFTDHG